MKKSNETFEIRWNRTEMGGNLKKKNKVDNIKDLLSLFKISFPETGKSQ